MTVRYVSTYIVISNKTLCVTYIYRNDKRAWLLPKAISVMASIAASTGWGSPDPNGLIFLALSVIIIIRGL